MAGPFQTEPLVNFDALGIELVRLNVAQKAYPHDIERAAIEWLARYEARERAAREAREVEAHNATVTSSNAAVIQARYAKRAFWVSIAAFAVSVAALSVSLLK